MRLLKCPKCGEMFSDTYKTCPFCQEDEELHSNRPVKRGTHRTGGGRAKPKVGGAAVVVCLVLVLGLAGYTIFGSQLTAFFSRDKDKPEPAPAVLTLSQSSVDMTVGGSTVLSASGAEGIVFSSSDESVATVAEDGTLQAVGAGSAIVTAKAGEQTATCQVTVEEPTQPETPTTPTPPATQALILRSIYQKSGQAVDEFTIAPGAKVPLVVEGTDSTVSWKIDDETVATISADGVVTGVSDDRSKVTRVTATVDGQVLICNVRGGGSNN